jgi:hypothetical protein
MTNIAREVASSPGLMSTLWFTATNRTPASASA